MRLFSHGISSEQGETTMRSLPVSDMWTVSISNAKTGVIPTQYVGRTREETISSCRGCNLHPSADGGCYAWTGRAIRAANSVRRAADRGRPSTLLDALDRTPRSACAVRFGAIGDPARVKRETTLADLATARHHKLKVLGYTHHWLAEPCTGVLRNNFLASCETAEQAEQAIDRGWLVALAGPESFAGMLTCPNFKRPEIQCNRCKLCDIPTLRRTRHKGIVFPAHGGSARRLPLA